MSGLTDYYKSIQSKHPEQIMELYELVQKRCKGMANYDVNKRNKFAPYFYLEKAKSGMIFAVIVTKELRKVSTNPTKVKGWKRDRVTTRVYPWNNYTEARKCLREDERLVLCERYMAYGLYFGQYLKELGGVSYHHAGNKTAYVDAMYVDDEFQNMGIATILRDRLMTDLKFKGYKNVTLDDAMYDTLNVPKGAITPSQKLWGKIGFEVEQGFEPKLIQLIRPERKEIKNNENYMHNAPFPPAVVDELIK